MTPSGFLNSFSANHKSRWNIGRRFIFSVPTLLTASFFIVPALSDGVFLPGSSKISLAHIMQIEYLVIASGMFLIFPMVFEPESKPGHIIRSLLFAGFALTFASVAYSINGLVGFCSYIVLIYVSYGGNTLLLGKQKAILGIGMLSPVRWIINLPVFFSLLVYFDLGEGNIANWDSKGAVVLFGAIFFVILFVLEFTLYYSLMVWVRDKDAATEAAQAAQDATRKLRADYYALFRK